MGAGSRPSRRSSRVVSWGSLCFGPANERNGIGEPLEVNSRLPMGSLRMFSLWHRFDGEEEKKIGRLLKLEVVVFKTASTASTAAQQEQEEKRSHTMGWITFPFFPRRPHPHPDSISRQVSRFLARPCSSWPGWHDGTIPWFCAQPPLSRACLPKLVCLSTSLFLQRDCGQTTANCKAPLQSHTRDKPTRASFRMVGSQVWLARHAVGWPPDGSHPLPLFCRHRSLARGGHLQATCRPARIYTGGLFQGPSNRSCCCVGKESMAPFQPLRPHGSDIRRWR